MGKKIEELSGWELTSALVELAEPVGNLAADDRFWKVFKACTQRAVYLREKDGLRFMLKSYSKLVPVLLSDEHKQDTMRILAVLEGAPYDEVMRRNGAEILKDLSRIFEDKVVPFFTKSMPTGQQE